MIKKIALAAFAAASMSVFGQDMQNGDRDHNDWATKYDTYNIGKVDTNGLNRWELMRIVHHDLKQANAGDAYLLYDFMQRLPEDQSLAMLRALAANYKQASMVRDEVAMARFGTDTTYAWLSYPPLTWSDTPGQNSWSAVTFATITPVTINDNGDAAIAMTDDQSRPMRMAMSRHGERDINYDRALDILCSGVSDLDRGILHQIFQPMTLQSSSYTNGRELDATIRVIEGNAAMVDHLGRWDWYNHFDTNYYNRRHNDW